MKKLIVAAVSFSLILAACGNQNQSANTVSDISASAVADSANGPVFEIVQNTYNFGTIKPGEKVAHDFKFKNTGKSPLIIADAQATCGCTVPEFPREPIAPGEEGTIKVVFNSEGKFGKQDKVVTITSNANPSATQLHMVGEIENKP